MVISLIETCVLLCEDIFYITRGREKEEDCRELIKIALKKLNRRSIGMECLLSIFRIVVTSLVEDCVFFQILQYC